MELIDQKKLLQVVTNADVICHSATEIATEKLDELGLFIGTAVEEWLKERGVNVTYARRYVHLGHKKQNKIHRKLAEQGLRVEVVTNQIEDYKWVTRVKLFKK